MCGRRDFNVKDRGEQENVRGVRRKRGEKRIIGGRIIENKDERMEQRDERETEEK